MNFKMKAVVAALALTASMSASAAMTNNISGDSSLILTVFDSTNKISATFDLGFTNSSFDRNSNFSWDVASGNYADAWNTFWDTASIATTEWAVASGDKLAPNEVFTTIKTLNATQVSRTELTNALGTFDQYLINPNNLIGNHQATANGASVAVDGDLGYAGSVYGNTGNYGAKFGDKTAALGSSMAVYSFIGATASGLTKITPVQVQTSGFSNYFALSSTGGLQYVAVPVPEADTWAMLLAGLGLMGFIARRRTAA